MASCVFSSDDLVIKSPNDSRFYRLIELENGLTALLVHDPQILPEQPPTAVEDGDDEDEDDDMNSSGEEDADDDDEEDDGEEDEKEDAGDKSASQTKKAAAAMCVGMGSFLDPEEAQGLAHFLEHMLFMGSTGFPDENEYDSYLSKHGGFSNAYTETERTCYHFEVKPEYLEGALKRFSQFFVAPLVKTEAMERELLAVDSEFNQALQSDSCRLQQLQCHTSAPGHPFNRFFWGNKKSLIDAMENGIDLREQIFRLYNEYYHGGLMKLVVIGGDSLDVLQKWVVELFGDVKKGSKKPEFIERNPIWKAGKFYRLEAVKDVHVLDLSWTLPCLRADYLKKSEDYLAHLLGHEGGGSLYFFLKAKGWITSISAGVGDEGMHRSSMNYIFNMSIKLTDSGLEQIFNIITFVYQYLKLLRHDSPQRWIYEELRDIAKMEFKFAEEKPQDEYASELAENMFVYPSKNIIFGEFAYEVWDEEHIKYILDFFKPKNMRIDVLSKSLPTKQDFLYEPWFGSKYAEEDVPLSLMKLWNDPPSTDSSLHLPRKNEFIPCDFSLRPVDSPESMPLPVCILDDSMMKLWYKQDMTFKCPRANVYFHITLKGVSESVRSCVLTELYVNLLKDELNDIIYQASVAKLETSLSIVGDKLELKVYGFNDKLSLLLSNIIAVASSFLPTEDRFQVIKEDLERSFKNANIKPLRHSSYLRLQILCQQFWDVEDKLQTLYGLSVDDLKAFVPSLLSQIYIEGLCHGNLLKSEALEIATRFRIYLTGKPLPIEMRHRDHVIRLPAGANLVHDATVKNKLEPNSILELYFQIESESETESIKLKAFADLFDEIVDEPCFNQLRTKEQLGYVVQSGPRTTYRVHGFCFCVQSSKYNPLYLQDRVENFLKGLDKHLDALDDESFENYKSGLIAKLLEKDPSLSYETSKFWGQITDKRYMFDMSAKEAEEVKTICKSEIKEWYKTYLCDSSPKCRRLAVRVWGCEAEMRKEEESRAQTIDDLVAFKTSSQFYTSLC
ncbi:unnamed protein product [Rhodiola kirilowii]